MLKPMIRVMTLSCLMAVWPVAAHAQWAVHALSGTVKFIDVPESDVDVTLADGSVSHFKIEKQANIALSFDEHLRSDTTPAASFHTVGAHVVVYYIGDGDTRTAVSFKDLGAGPFDYLTGNVVHYDKHTRELTMRLESGTTTTCHVSDKAVIDTGDGVEEGNKFDPGKGYWVRITAVKGSGADEAVFVRRRMNG